MKRNARPNLNNVADVICHMMTNCSVYDVAMAKWSVAQEKWKQITMKRNEEHARYKPLQKKKRANNLIFFSSSTSSVSSPHPSAPLSCEYTNFISLAYMLAANHMRDAAIEKLFIHIIQTK